MMGGLSIWHWLIAAAVAALLFGGGGKISGLMGDAAKGIKAFRDGMKDEESGTPPEKPATLTAPEPPAQPTQPAPAKREDVAT